MNIELFWARLEMPPFPSWHLEKLLSNDERARVRGLVSPVLQQRQIVFWAIQRSILAQLTGCEPTQLHFDRSCTFCGGAHGKPRLIGSSVKFSASHTGSTAVWAVSNEGDVGIDIEECRQQTDWFAISDVAFSQREQHEIAAVPRPQLKRRSARLWTRKEAVAKLDGRGLALSLSNIDVRPYSDGRWSALVGGDALAHGADCLTGLRLVGAVAAWSWIDVITQRDLGSDWLMQNLTRPSGQLRRDETAVLSSHYLGSSGSEAS
jgi:4'-phosphopantetheinyl transferase